MPRRTHLPKHRRQRTNSERYQDDDRLTQPIGAVGKPRRRKARRGKGLLVNELRR